MQIPHLIRNIVFLLMMPMLLITLTQSQAEADWSASSRTTATGPGHRYTETIPVIDIEVHGYRPASLPTASVNHSQFTIHNSPLTRGGGSDPNNPYAVLRKTGPTFLSPGSTAQYAITLNNFESITRTYQLTETLPAELTYITTSNNELAYDDNTHTLSWQGELAPGNLDYIIEEHSPALPYLDLGREENPFLGYRGIRFCLHRPDIFKPQLRAILRASQGHNLRVMFPMIGTLAELRAARAMLAEAQAELRAENVPFDEGLAVGIMIEVPSAVATADQLAGEADFFSIGTNDLTQYVMAADRGNANVAGLANALQPAVLRMIQQTVRAAHAAGIWVGMCGELAGNALATPLLVGLGLDELSMSAPALPAVKAAVRGLTMAEASALAGQVLAQVSVDGVMALLGA